MKNSRLMRVWGEFENKIKFASYRPTPEGFLEQIKAKMGIEKIRNSEIIELLTQENIKLIREQPTKLMLILRSLTDVKKRKWKEAEKLLKTTGEKKEYKVAIGDLFLELENKNSNEIIEKTDEIDAEFAEIFGL
jgi:phosphotransferase system IIB component